MSGDENSHGFNKNHQHHLRTTFQYIDKLLTETEHAMAEAGSPSPFHTYSDDTTPVVRKVTHDYILRIREAMRRIMEEFDIAPSEPRSGAIWAAGINLMFCTIAIDELVPEKMRGYGPIDSEATARMDAIRAELYALIGKLRNYLGTSGGSDLQARLQRLGKTGDETCLLAEIERIITAHGLVEFRGALAMLLDRIESAAFEVGVFGRVSSGKSSLLNYILQTDMLPVGVTPVTAIPTRIRHGAVAEAGIEFAEAQPRIIPLSELVEFATEEQNPGNRKHVTRIVVNLPSQRLREGVTFVDTPGLGSLAAAGAEETVAYLPRCDLGIVLIDASSGLTHDDLIVIQALYQAGATAMVLVSKADLFTAADLDRMLAYVKSNLQSQIHIDLPVHAVSVVGANARLCDQWFEEELRPFLARHRELIIESNKRKVGALRETVIAALQRRLHLTIAPASDDDAVTGSDAMQVLRDGDTILERAQAQALVLTSRIPRLKPEIIQASAENIAAAMLNSGVADTAAVFARTLTDMLGEPVASVLHAVEQTRDALSQALRVTASANDRGVGEELPKPTGMPALDVNEISKGIVINKPAVISLLGKGALTLHVRRKLETDYDGEIYEFLTFNANRLWRWMQQSTEAMRIAFTASADTHRAQFETAQFDSSADRGAIQNDFQILRDWDAPSQESHG